MAKYLDSNYGTLNTSDETGENQINDFLGPKYLHDAKTGISKFHLSTLTASSTGEGSDAIVLTGLLNELPEFSFTINYEDGPGKAWQDTIEAFTGNDLVQLVTQLGAAGDGAKNIVSAGAWTKKIYAGYSMSTIPLKFRIYTSDTLGQTDPDIWITALATHATISSDNLLKPEVLLLNGLNAVANVSKAAVDIANVYNNKDNNRNDSDSERFAKEQNTAYKSLAIIRKAISTNPHKNNFNVVCTRSSSAEYKVSVNGSEPQSFGSIPEEPAEGHVNFVSISNFLSALDNISFGNDPKWAETKRSIRKIIEKEESRQDNEDDYKSLKNTLDTIEQITDTFGNYLVSKYDEYRVVRNFNKSGMLGQKLWYLSLYEDVVFNKATPLIVYIADWSVQPSEEFDISIGKPIYYDFSITCALDQVYSLEQWQRVLANDYVPQNN